MLKNYLKTAIAVLLRRKFLTFVNLFGTVLTLTVLIVAFAIVQCMVHPGGAEHRYGHILSVSTLWASNSSGQGNSRMGFPGGAFFSSYVKPLRTPDLVSYSSSPGAGTSYADGRKLTLQVRRTDAAYWRILDFKPVMGRLLAPDDIDSGRSVAVINESTARAYFAGRPPLGQPITIDFHPYQVIGVVRDEPETSHLAYADVWVPITASDTRTYEQEWFSAGQILLYVDDAAKLRAVREEIRARLRRLEVNPDPGKYDTLQAPVRTPLEELAAQRVGHSWEDTDDVPLFLAAAVLGALLFMALPALNLVNLNIARIMERAPEIGLRKAAGAPALVLVGQFIFENLVLALVGGLISLGAAPLVLGVLSGVFRYGQLRLDVWALAAGLAFVTVFGVLSGAYPAWKMAQLPPAEALRGGRHV
jgi:putative ABC transport system permease protein